MPRIGEISWALTPPFNFEISRGSPFELHPFPSFFGRPSILWWLSGSAIGAMQLFWLLSGFVNPTLAGRLRFCIFSNTLNKTINVNNTHLGKRGRHCIVTWPCLGLLTTDWRISNASSYLSLATNLMTTRIHTRLDLRPQNGMQSSRKAVVNKSVLDTLSTVSRYSQKK